MTLNAGSSAITPQYVYIRMTPEYEEINDTGVPMVMRLLKSLESLRQTPRCWHGMVDYHMVEIGFKSLTSDYNVPIYSGGRATYI